MRALITLCLASLATATAVAQSQPTMLSQSRYRIEQGGVVEFLDSVVHTHSNGRISYGLPVVDISYNPNDGIYNADESIRVAKNLSSNALYLVDKMTRQFNSTGQISEYHELIKKGGVLLETFKELYSYNQALQPDTTWTMDATVNRRHTYSYQNGIQISGTYEDYDATGKTWKLVGVDSFQANGTDSTYVLYWKTSPAPPQVYEKHKYGRDANLRVVADTLYHQFNSLASITYTTYDASGRKEIDSVYSGINTYSYKKRYLYDGNGNLISENQYMWNTSSSSYTDRTLDTFTYNPVNQLTSARSYTLSGGNWVPQVNSFSRYYYYGFPAGVNEVADEQPLRLYPVPATSYINIDMNFSKPEKFSVRILDIQGRIVRQWEEAAQTTYKKKIQLDGMTAGNYIVHVSSESNNITRQFSVLQ